MTQNLSSASKTSKASFDLSSALREATEIAGELRRRKRTNLLRDYRPYPKQIEYHNRRTPFDTIARECLFMAGNQLGKTVAGAAEAAMHLTGEYPDWWEGKTFGRPITMLAGSESYELTRDGVQRLDRPARQ